MHKVYEVSFDISLLIKRKVEILPRSLKSLLSRMDKNLTDKYEITCNCSQGKLCLALYRKQDSDNKESEDL